MKIYIGTDHAGFQLKEKLFVLLCELGHNVIDRGAFGFNESDDYPDFIYQVGQDVSSAAGDENVRGIVLGGSGQGEAILANKFPGIRAIVYYGSNMEIIRLSREHNDSNILSLGARFLEDNEDEAFLAVREWLDTPFSGEERHIRRNKKIREIENQLKK